MFTSTGVVFQDDSYEEIDDVILATGKFILIRRKYGIKENEN